MSQNRALRRLLFALFLVGLIVIIYGNTTKFPRQEHRFPNGSTLALEAITYGPEHHFIHASWWQLLLRPVLPDKAWERLGGVEVTRTLDDPQVPVVWLRASGQTSPFDITRLTVFDEHGCETPLMGQHFRRDVFFPGGRVTSCPLSAYPRCGKRLGLRFYQVQVNAPWKPVATLRLPISPPRTVTQWPPAPLPATVREGDLTCTLTRFVTGTDLLEPTRPTQDGGICEATTRLTLELQQEGRKVPEWQPVGVELRDAPGNVFAPGPYVNPRRRGAITEMGFLGNLFPDGQPWKLRVELARTETASFADSELWAVDDVPIPRRGEPFVEPATVRSKRLGSGTATLSNIRWDSMGPPYAEVVVMLEGADLPGTWVSLVRAVDDRGREVSHPNYPETYDYSNSPAQVWFILPLLITRQTRTVELTLAVQRT